MTQSSSHPPADARGAEPAAPAPARGIFVRAMILLTALIFVLTVSLIFYRWVTVQEPTWMIIVEGWQQLEGAVATVSGVALDEPLVVEFTEYNRYRGSFFLHPGSYQLQVTLHDELIYAQPLPLPDGPRRVGRIRLREIMEEPEQMQPDSP